MPNRDKANGRNLPIPSFDDPAGWALWRLSMILKEIADDARDGASPQNDEAAISELAGNVREEVRNEGRDNNIYNQLQTRNH